MGSNIQNSKCYFQYKQRSHHLGHCPGSRRVNSDGMCPATAPKMEGAEGEGMPVVSKSWGAFPSQKGNSLGPEATQN